MSVRVNLLPKEIEAAGRARHVGRLSVLGVVAVVLVLGGVSFVQMGDRAQAEQDRDAAQTRVAQAEARVAALAEYRELQNRYLARRELLSTAMAEEVSWARILNDLSLAFPADASLVTLNAQAESPEPPSAGEIDPGARVGRIVASGYSLERYAPGVESVLLDFEGAQGFFNSYLQTAAANTIGEADVTNFSGTIDLDDNAYTGRYAEGLPPEVTE